MDTDFEWYERDYLRRVSSNQPPTAAESRQRFLQEDACRTAREATLDSWDYAILEMLKRDNPVIELKCGTVRTSESLLRLYCHNLIQVSDYTPTFDELERLQAILDSPAFRQYMSRLGKLMTKEVQERLELIYSILGIKFKVSFLQKIKGPDARMFNYIIALTEAGQEILDAKRMEAISLYEKMSKQYSADKSAFYRDMETVQPYMMMLPLMISMGFTGSVMSYMMASSSPEYMMLVDVPPESNFGYESGFGDLGFGDLQF